MILALIEKDTGVLIAEVEADFIPAVGDEFVYEDGQADEKFYKLEKVLKPTLVKGGVKYYKVWVTAA